MKLQVLLVILILPFTIYGQLDKSVVAYYSFDACSTKDIAGNGNVTQVNGSPICVCGVSDTALKFNGINDELFFIGTVSDNFQNADFTIAFYFKPDVQLGNQVLLSKREDCNNINALSVNFNLSSSTLTVLMAESDNDKIVLSYQLDKGVCWQHVVIERRNKAHLLYINDKLVAQQNSTKRLKLGNNDPFGIAKGQCPGELKFKGAIDEIYIYNKAIDEPEIKKLYLKPDNIANFDTLIYLGGNVPIKITHSCASSFSWQPISGVSDPSNANATLSPLQTTTYKLEFNVDGCIASDTINIQVVDPSTIPCDHVFLPNAFTPNGDGLNDLFGISNPLVVQAIKSFEIYDSWGGKMFVTSDVFEKWDGKFNGVEVNPGVYLYKVVFNCKGSENLQQGSITLMR
ncbi:MAG TPA: LamG-like jellyroll fold domain-containing protein [Saprospiraceae bacterium]|nr:LamG-like jellyroll fold domain-containing protein [Saprospiraceae bacterium]